MSPRFRHLALLLVFVIVLGSAAGCSSRSTSARSGETGLAGLPSWAGADLPIAAAGEDHLEGLRQLTTGESARDVVWSADGATLLYASRHSPYPCDQVFSVESVEPMRTPQLVSSGRGWAGSPSPLQADGRILFAASENERNDCGVSAGAEDLDARSRVHSADLYSAERNGSGRRRLTHTSRFGDLASVSRTGRVVLNSFRNDFLNLATITSINAIDAADPAISALTSEPSRDDFARFSDDGERIVYASRRNSGGLEIRIVRADGRENRAVTGNGATNLAPAFFPGRTDRILFSSNLADPQGRNFDLWAVNADGTDLERLTYHPAFDGFASFSPDGRRLAFASSRHAGRPGERNVFVADWIP